jgi:hypothetical protein
LQQEAELIPAHARNQVVASDMGQENLAHDAQNLVADVVTMGVVDALEVIDIRHYQVRG